MADSDQKPLVPSPPNSFAPSGDGAQSVVTRMSSEILAVVRAQERELEQARFRIGRYQFRGPDHRQILRWSEALHLSSERFVRVLAGTKCVSPGQRQGAIEFTVIDGCISSLVWDFAEFPLDEFQWEDGLRIRALGFRSVPPCGRVPVTYPSSLRRLFCENLSLKELDLSGVPGLVELYCSKNHLDELDLSRVPGLVELDCSNNYLRALHLSSVPKLKLIRCRRNQLTVLALSEMTELSIIDCSMNRLTELRLSSTPNLLSLDCNYNQLKELELSGAPGLDALFCEGNQLAEVDVSRLKHPGYIAVSSDVRIIGTVPEGCRVTRSITPPADWLA